MKKTILTFIMIIIFIFLSGCNSDLFTPINVSFKNQTLLGSENYTLVVVYAEDKRIRDKYTDLYISADLDNIKLKITKELGESYNIEIPNSNTWYSLTNLIGQKLHLATFATVETTIYIINSNKTTTIKLKAMGGDLIYNLDTGESSLTNAFEVSKEFELKVNKII